MNWHRTDLEIRYADTDQMGVVHHAVYPIYCEIGRTSLCEHLGLPYHELEGEGIYLMVASMSGRYRAPARYGEPIFVRTRIARLRRRLIEFEYEVCRQKEDHMLFTGATTHLFTQRTEGTISLPEGAWRLLSSGLVTG